MKVDNEVEPAATLGVAFCAAILLTSVLAATGGTRMVGTDLVLYTILAGTSALTARWWVAITTAVMVWFFFDGFLAGRHGDIAWHGAVDLWRFGVILAAALGGWLVQRVVRITARLLPRALEALRMANVSIAKPRSPSHS